ncbi:hypothetical protein [Actinoplanes italicus]|uniref:Uncharacterized protein n=1 Tax=Actinoplanes italicus TaxID=113567 RepID=A0A2T0KCF7_9ACTN|nr:hypothetical protein [Actinoplanes italicus]PRX20579.1 hypothetical protein CLV67_108380 [Actinoplanes italicus]
MAPSDEALAWQRRADDWAQQAEVEPYNGGGGQAIEPANRWSSEVTTTGRPTFPADGVGWRTETAEWRATGARWRQTTEWRSATGSHVWRSTTEAWRSEDEAAQEREKPSIPGTAWETGSESDAATPSWRRSAPETPSWRQPEPDPPSWRQSEPEAPSWRRNDPDTSSSWQRRSDLPAATTPVEQTPSWRQPSAPTPSAQTPSWQQPSTQTPSAQTPSWQQPQQTPSWQQPSTQTPSWQQEPAAQTPSWQQPQQTPSWQQPSAPAQSRRRGADTGSWSTAAASGPAWSDRPGPGDGRPGPGENTTGLTRWERTEAPGWQRSPAEDARHLVRDDDRAAWNRDAGYTDRAGYGERPTRAGRRRAAENQAAPSGGSGWSSGADDDWAGHTDTGSIPVFDDREDAPEAPAWGARSEAPSRRDRRRQAEESRPEPPRAEPGGRRGSQGGRQPRYNANPTNWREDTASWDAEQDTSNWTRDPDTGQWSRAEDDPRVLAWRAEAARREAMRDDEPENTGRRGRRADPPGGVPGGPLPSSSIPARDAGGSGWAASGPMDDGPTRRRRPDDPYRTDGFGGGRRRASDSAPPEEPISSEAWQAAPEPRQTRQNRRMGGAPDGRRPGPMPPQWSDNGVPEPRRQAYPDDSPAESPRWQDPGYGGGQRELPSGGGFGQSRPEQPPRSGFGSAARELPAGPSAPPQRPAYGARELPAGPSAQQQPGYGARELPAAPASGPAWQEPQRPAYGGPPPGQSWLEQERQQRQAPQRPAYGSPAGGETSWTDQERQRPQGAQGPSYGGSGVPSQPSGYDMPSEPRRPGYGSARALPAGSSAPASGPAWAAQQKPVYGNAPVSSPGDPSARWTDPLTDTSSRRGRNDRDDPPPPAGGGFGGRPPLADWLAAERAGRRGAGAEYRGAGQDGETDWRRELSRQSDLAEGESRRYDTSDFPPFRPSGSAAVDGSANLALSATSVIQAPRTADGAGAEEDTSWPPRRNTGAFQGTGAYERRPMVGDFPSNRQNDLLDPDDDEEQEDQESSPLAAVGYTVVWYGVPVVLFVAGIFLLNSGQRDHALETLADAAPEFGISLALSMLVAYGLRTATTAWKSASVGLAAAVVGGGLATVLSSAITGNSLS